MAWFVRRVLFITWPVLEILLLVYVAGIIGWGWVLLILFGGVVAAVALLQAAGRNVWQVLTDPRRRQSTFTMVDPVTGATTTLVAPPEPRSPDQALRDEVKVRESGLLVTAAVLLAIPGFISDFAGLLVMLPPIRLALATRAARRARTRVTVVQGETIAGSTLGDPSRPSESGSPEPNRRPTTIMGEILPPSSTAGTDADSRGADGTAG